MKPVNELEGADLAEAVARALGWMVYRDGNHKGACLVCQEPDGAIHSFGEYGFRPDRDWEHGGPIIERERIGTSFDWASECWRAFIVKTDASASGPTPLIAAMRAYVASKTPAQAAQRDDQWSAEDRKAISARGTSPMEFKP